MKHLYFLLLVLALGSGTMQLLYCATPRVYWKIPRIVADRYFAHHLTLEEMNKITFEDKMGKWVRWPQDPDYDSTINKEFRDYLFRSEKFYINSYPYTTDAEKNTIIPDLTKRVWIEIPKSVHIPDTLRKFVQWENFANQLNDPYNRRAPHCFAFSYYEIPFDLIDDYKADYVDPAIWDLMVFQDKDGDKVVRWPINPEDGKYFSAVEAMLKRHNIEPRKVRKVNYIGFLTASRSMIVFDPKTKNIWSVKTSTDHTGGIWHKKQMFGYDVRHGMYASDHIFKVQQNVKFKRLQPMMETIGGHIGGRPEVAFIVREYPKSFVRGETYLIPGFSAVNERIGKEIAVKNGRGDDIAGFWRDNYNKVLGEMIGELSAFCGLTYESAHGQQFLIEMDKNLRPTGKILARDFADSYFFTPYFKYSTKDHASLLGQWWVIDRHSGLKVRFGVFKTLMAPSWIFSASEREAIAKTIPAEGLFNIPESMTEMNVYKNNVSFEDRDHLETKMNKREYVWAEEFFKHFEYVYQKAAGVNIEVLEKTTGGTPDTYITKTYIKNDFHAITSLFISPSVHHSSYEISNEKSNLKKYLANISCFQGAKYNLNREDCGPILEKINNR